MKNTSQHILNTAANLLGFCLFIITSLHLNNQAASTFIDESAGVVTTFLAFACFFSFGAISTTNKQRSITLENIADYLFIISLIGILLLSLFITFSII